MLNKCSMRTQGNFPSSVFTQTLAPVLFLCLLCAYLFADATTAIPLDTAATAPSWTTGSAQDSIMQVSGSALPQPHTAQMKPALTVATLPLASVAWGLIALCAAITYYLKRKPLVADFFGFTIFSTLLCLLLPTEGAQEAISVWQSALIPVFCAGALYFFWRTCEQWLGGSKRCGKSVRCLLHWFKRGSQIACAVFLVLAMLPGDFLPFAKIIVAAICVMPFGIVLIAFCEGPAPTQGRPSLLTVAAVIAFAVFSLLALGRYAFSESGAIAPFASPSVALVALFAIAARNDNALLRKEAKGPARRVRNLERKDEDLRNSLLQVSSRLRQDRNSHERMLRLLSHDLRSPIASLQAFANIIIEKNGEIPPQEINEIAREIHRTCSLQLELLHNLLSLGSSSAEAALPRPSRVNPADTVAWAWDNVAELARRKQITLSHTHTGTAPCYTGIDPNALQTILRNLFTNAIKFSHPHQTVRVGIIGNATGTITIRVEDNGVGIDAKGLKKIFQDEPHSTPGTLGEKGIGIGLKLCQELAATNQSTLALESTPGRGTTLLLTVPPCPQQETPCGKSAGRDGYLFASSSEHRHCQTQSDTAA